MSLWSLLHSRCEAQLPTASLRTIWPCAIQAGTSTEVFVEGDFLDEAEELYFSDPRIIARLKTGGPLPGTTDPSKQYSHFTIEVPADMPAGRVDAWVRGRYGISNPRRLSIEHVPVVRAEGDRFSADKSQEFAPAQIMLGRVTAGQVDHYRMQLDAGTLVRIRCDALAIDSALVPAIIVCDSGGKELQRVRGTKLADATLTFAVQTPGTYFLKVHDVLFRGGNTYFYRLRLDTEAKPESLDSVAETRLAEQPVLNLEQHLTSSGNVRRLPASELATAPSVNITVPENILSSFPKTGVPSASFDFDAKGGQSWWVEVTSAATGAATDPDMQIGRLRPQADGSFQFERLHHIDDVTSLPGSLLGSTLKDPVHLFRIPEDGRYRVTLRDLQTTSDRSWKKSFLLSIRPTEADFSLLAMLPHATLDPARSSPAGTIMRRGEKLALEVGILTAGGFFEPVTAVASLAGGGLQLKQTIDWNWPVTVTAEGLPSGLTCSSVNLNNVNRRGHLILEAADDVAAWTGPIRIIGTVTIPAELGGQVLRREAKPISLQMPDPDGRGQAVVRACDQLRLATTDLEVTPVKVAFGGESRDFSVKLGTELEIPVTIIRSESAKAKITLRPVGLPPNSTAAEVNLEGDTLTANLKLTVPANVPLGEYQIFLNGEIEVAWPRNPQAVTRAEQRLEALKQQLVAAEASGAEETAKGALRQQVTDAEAAVNQLREATKPQAARAFLPSNPVNVRVLPAQ